MISEVIKNYINRMQKFSDKEKETLNIVFNNFDDKSRDNIDFTAYTKIREKLTEEEQEILHLKKLLYSMDELTINESTEAKEILNNKRIGPINILKKLELMIPIKQQIIGKKIRKFNVGKNYARGMSEARLKAKSTIIYAQLLSDNTVQLTGHINTILEPYYHVLNNKHEYYENIAESYIGYDEENQDGCTYGNWRISGNFKILKWEHTSDKNWKYDSSFSEIKE